MYKLQTKLYDTQYIDLTSVVLGLIKGWDHAHSWAV